MRPTRVLLLYNEPTLPANHPDADSEHEITYTIDEVTKVLVPAGYEVVRLGVSRDPAPIIPGIRDAHPDVVFNLFEGLPDWGDTEAYAVAILEWMGVPYTGSPIQPILIARNKPLAKKLLRGAGLPTPAAFVIEELPVRKCPLDWPVILKPSNQDASVGIEQSSVVTDLKALNARAKYLLDHYGPPVLAEEYIAGREFCVGLIEDPELRCLPIAEMEFISEKPGHWAIITYDAKWKPGTPDYEVTPARYPAENVPPKLEAKVYQLARKAYKLMGCRDYGRVDFRINAQGKPYILEVNPNPDFSPMAGLSGGLESAQVDWEKFAIQLVRQALARGGNPEARPGAAPMPS